MLSRFRKILLQLAFGRQLHGLEAFTRALRVQDDSPHGACAYCQQQRKLCEVLGPLGTGGVFVCRPCAIACVAIIKW